VKTRISNLKYAVAPLALGLALISAPSFAQDKPADETTADDSEAIVVTGSMLRRTDNATPSPVSVITSEDLDKRGVNTIQDAIQSLASNNGAALTNGFTANGAFAGGASAVSLRGLSTNSTLVLFDGLRAAYYPLADDGSRNFVDLNTIPDDVVERIEVLRDGASSNYGADAIAGVVNIITKKQITGVNMRAEAGISQDGIGANQRLSLSAGTGDLDEKGFNAYVSGFYYHSAVVNQRDLGAPYNTDDQRSICDGTGADRICGPNNVTGGLDSDGLYQGFAAPTDFFVRPYDATNTAAQGRYQQLNPVLGCQHGSRYALTPADLALQDSKGNFINGNAPLQTCTEDNTNQYGVVSPNIERFGGTARFTAKIGDSSEAYAMFNFQQATSGYAGLPATIRGNAPTGIRYPRFSTSSGALPNAPGSGVLTLPIYVCAARVNCTAANGTLNPNNPFAAAGQVARITGRIPTRIFDETQSRVYRAGAGIKGTFLTDWDYQFDATLMHTDLRRKKEGFVYIQHLLDVIADGSYNFVNPAANSQATIDYLTPTKITNASSDLYQAQISIGKALFELPGGPLQLGVGGSVFYEAVNSPSGNDDYNGPTQRYFTLNAFGTVGSRTVYSAFGEVNAPILDQLELNAAGRYDHYSSGQSAFSPKFGFKFTPIKQIALRGTYSKGFRIPSFGEANALPTTGYVPVALASVPNSFLQQYGAGCTNTTTAACPTYLTTATYGLTTLASPNLKPEKSRSFTLGVLVEPIRNVSFTVDYYNIKKTGAITTASNAPAIAAYYAGQPIPAGFNVIADAPDVNNPTARPRIAFIETSLINANTIKSEGVDFGANFTHSFGDVTWNSNAEASLILELSTSFPDGSKETYVGTLGNYNLTAGTGTFKWRGSWQNTLDFNDKFSLSATVNYVDGYDLSAEDQTGSDTAGKCGLSAGYTPCRVKSYITTDIVGNVKVNDKFSVYLNVLNAFDKLPPIDPVTYGAYLYNTVQAGNGILGRQFRAGVKVNF
jgi:iron complex outermembrane recepter protein